jgi:ribosomal protein S18 acetylase RimI-like enzyme
MRPMPPTLQPERDPEIVLAIYRRAVPAHTYGIADVVQLWDTSTWWVRGDAVVGLLDLPGSPAAVLYAVEAGDGRATLELLDALRPALPGHLVATGPDGMADVLAPDYEHRWRKAYVKLHLVDAAALPAADARARRLSVRDAASLDALFATDPVPGGRFFHLGLLEDGLYVGIEGPGGLVAVAGTHVVEPAHGVAALGNVVTHPEHRRRGLGAAVVGTLCHALLPTAPTIALNVERANAAARGLYERLGFRTVLPYEEAELVRR